VNLELSNRIAIVTGSTRGIGKAIACCLAKEGAQVTICGRNLNQLMDTARNIATSTRTEILPIQVDLRKKEDIQILVEKTIKEFGRIDILVNNMGGPPSRLFLETSEDD